MQSIVIPPDHCRSERGICLPGAPHRVVKILRNETRLTDPGSQDKKRGY